MEKKQTALDLYVEQSQILQDKFDVGLISFLELCRQKVILLDQAKQMEKEQMIDAILDNRNITSQVTLRDAEQYYNETFGGNNE